MTIVLETVARDDMANAIDDSVNVGGGTAELRFETSGDAEVATIALQNPAFGGASTGVITMAGQPISDASATGGVVAQFSIYDRAALKQLEGTVLTSGGDINLTSLTVAATEEVELTTFTITVPA